MVVRVLVVDDYPQWLRFILSIIQQVPELQVIAQASDGIEAVQKAKELQPDLILLDISLPSLSGIHAARQIRQIAPNSKILFVSENRSPEIAEEALNAGGKGFVLKSDSGRELLPAIKTVLEDKRFISASMAGHFVVAATLTTQVLSWLGTLISGMI
jgi:DNA-binding NarL/FixJ family response regulator